MREQLHEQLCTIEYVEHDKRSKMYEEIFIPFLEKLREQDPIFFRGVASVFYSEIIDAKDVPAEKGKEPNAIRRAWERYKFRRWSKKNPGKGVRAYLLSMGPFIEVPAEDVKEEPDGN